MTFGTKTGWAITVIGGSRLTLALHHYRRASYRTKCVGRLGLSWPRRAS